MAKEKKVVPMIDMEEDAKGVTDTSIARLVELINEQRALEGELLDLEEQAKATAQRLAYLVENTIPSFFDEVGVKEIVLPDGAKVTVEEKVYPNISRENWDAAYAWLKENNFDSIVKNEVKISFSKGEDKKVSKILELLLKNDCQDFTNKQFIAPPTLGAFVRERLAEGADISPAISVNPVRKSVIKQPKR